MLSPCAASSGRSAAISRRLTRVNSAPRSSRTSWIVRLDIPYAHVDHLLMRTNRSETRTIAIAAAPDAVLDYVGDARTLPEWAPGFTGSVRAEGEHWRVDGGLIDVRVSRERGTVDIVSVSNPARGVYTRVLPNGEGSQYLFTQFFPDAMPEADVDRQLAVVEGELRAVRAACEAR